MKPPLGWFTAKLRMWVLEAPLLVVLLLVGGCQTLLIDPADREVYRLIEARQQAALGEVHSAHIGVDDGAVARADSMYRFVPHPVDSAMPEVELPPPVETPAAQPQTQASPVPPGIEPPEDPEPADAQEDAAREAESPGAPAVEEVEGEAPEGSEAELIDEALLKKPELMDDGVPEGAQVFSIADALAYAMRHARTLQNAKEELYLAALDLTLERHLWTPQFSASVETDYANYGQVADFDHAMDAVSTVAVAQQLPLGGQVTASIINNFMRDLGNQVTTGETGNVVLSADIPLLRGAGRSAYESRFQAERSLIYAVRTYERFRRTLLVDLAGDYFNLQQLKAAIANSRADYFLRADDYREAAFSKDLEMDRTVFDIFRAKASWRDAEAALVNAREQYATALDSFKIRIGMPVDEPLDVVSQEQDAFSGTLDELRLDLDLETLIEVALGYRLDLINRRDWVDDARRGVQVARNRILPDLDLTGSATLDTDPNRWNSVSYNTERVTWQSGLRLSLDDRKSERNAYRASLISLRQAERSHEEFSDSVRAQVRRALRRLEQQESVREIQALQVAENELRAEAARSKYDLGEIDNRDRDDALRSLLSARNSMARAVANYRSAVLEFLRDTGTLRVTEDGKWHTPFVPPAPEAGSESSGP